MKATGSCPKCSGRELYIVSPVRQRLVGSLDVAPVPVVATNLSGHEETLQTGTHELWICGSCSYEEWYAANLNRKMLEALLLVPEAGVRKQGVSKTGYR